MPRRYARYTTSDCARPRCPCPPSTADTATTPPDVVCRSMWVWGSAALRRWIRSVVNSAAVPDHSESCCGWEAADPDAQPPAHTEASSAAAALRRRRDRTRDDVVVTEPVPPREAGIIRELPPSARGPAGDDN